MRFDIGKLEKKGHTASVESHRLQEICSKKTKFETYPEAIASILFHVEGETDETPGIMDNYAVIRSLQQV